ncbi:MAG: KAP family NTPase [Acidobacteria bacterium]|nr:KAP family NTPase [Acidobacteriota bacterium]
MESFSPDRPIQSPAEDRFNRLPFARRIVQAIANRTDPSSLAIGIYGRYGEGKTSVLNLLREELHSDTRFVVVPFNPWLFGDQKQLLTAFFYTLADGLGRTLKQRKEEIGEILTKYSFALAALKLPGLDLSKAAKELGQQLSTVQLEELRKRLERILTDSGKRAVVIVDDIDRLDRTEIQAIFKLVKVAADFEHLTYVLAFDDDMVADALGERFPGGGKEAGRAFLEKIIQVPLHLPPADKLTLRQATFQGVDAVLHANKVSLDQNTVQWFAKTFIDGLEIRLTTPRMVSRYVNAITFAIPQLVEEANIADCLLIEGLRVFYPNLYTTIRGDPEVFLGPESALQEEDWKKRAQKVIEGALNGLALGERSAASELVQELFPRTKSILGNIRFGDNLDQRLAREQRIASSDYFWKFFQYAIPARDISDRTVQQFVASLTGVTVEQIEEQIRELAAHNREERLIAKLREREKTVEPTSAEKLALALAGLGAIFPNPDQLFPFVAPFPQAAILVSRLVQRLPAGDQRETLARQVIERARPTAFAIEMLRWLRKSKDQDESERILSVEVENTLLKKVAERIAAEALNAPPHLTDTKSAASLFSMWFTYGEKESLKTYLIQRFDGDPTEAAKFLGCYLPTVWAGDTGLPRKGSISRETYDGIANVVDPELMISYLRKVYGDALDDDKFFEERKGDPDAKAAATFVRMHKAVCADRSTPPPEIQGKHNDISASK